MFLMKKLFKKKGKANKLVYTMDEMLYHFFDNASYTDLRLGTTHV